MQRHASINSRSRSRLARYLGSVCDRRPLPITAVRRGRPHCAHIAGCRQYASQSDVHPAFVAAGVEQAGRVPLRAPRWHALRARSDDATCHAVDEPVRGPNAVLLPCQSTGPVARRTNISPHARPATVSARAGPAVAESGGLKRARSPTPPVNFRRAATATTRPER